MMNYNMNYDTSFNHYIIVDCACSLKFKHQKFEIGTLFIHIYEYKICVSCITHIELFKLTENNSYILDICTSIF